MKLYRLRVDPSGSSTWCRETVFKTSLVNARRAARKFAGRRVVIDECHVQNHLSMFDWIDLLTFDSPGMQEGRTPVDFIESWSTVWTNERKKNKSGEKE